MAQQNQNVTWTIGKRMPDFVGFKKHIYINFLLNVWIFLYKEYNYCLESQNSFFFGGGHILIFIMLCNLQKIVDNVYFWTS